MGLGFVYHVLLKTNERPCKNSCICIAKQNFQIYERRPHDHEVSDLDLEAPSNNSFGFTGNEDTMFERATFALGKHRSDSNEIKY